MILYGLGMCVMFAFSNGCAQLAGPETPEDLEFPPDIILQNKLRFFFPRPGFDRSIDELDRKLDKDISVGKISRQIMGAGPEGLSGAIGSDDQSRDGNTHTLYTVDTKDKKCEFTVVTDENDIIKKITTPLCVDAE